MKTSKATKAEKPKKTKKVNKAALRRRLRKARRVGAILMNDQAKRMAKRGFVTVALAARMAGLSVPRIYELLNDGRLFEERKGSRRYVEKKSLLPYLPDEA